VAKGRPLPAKIEQKLRDDPRPGARAILAAVERRRREHRSEGQRLRWISRYERELWARGLELVAGVDEAGMSPLAGPVAAGAVILPIGWRVPGIDDSKKLAAAERAVLAPIIREHAIAWSVAFVDHLEIDRINIYWAGLLAMRRAVEGLRVMPQYLLIDARRIDLPIEQKKIIKGDEKCVTIAAASILAKTSRDALMIDYDRQYPDYGFARHKGYPVPEHRAALARLGPCAIHRRTFVG
jgi:ribonuclease HII